MVNVDGWLEDNAIFFKGFYQFKLIPLVVYKSSEWFISLSTFVLLIFTCYFILFLSVFHRCTEVEHMFLSQVNFFLNEITVNLLLVISTEMFVSIVMMYSENFYIFYVSSLLIFCWRYHFSSYLILSTIFNFFVFFLSFNVA